jgi:hypothetical protein
MPVARWPGRPEGCSPAEVVQACAGLRDAAQLR